MDIKQSTISFYHKCVRVWYILRKPSAVEFKTVAKVSAIGIGLIGIIGFIITIIMGYIV